MTETNTCWPWRFECDLGTGIAGRLTDAKGQPIQGAGLTIEAVDVAGRLPPRERQLTGTVPHDAATAMIGIRANTEASCVCAGNTDATVGLIHYAESGSGRSLNIAPGAAPVPRTIKLLASQTVVWNLK
ncbi:MAG: hypothetical protein JOZ94_21080 [Xanthobacteraceae bacterium]|nr:hypothetical protein [Xanthobacteraceae bacterium]